MNRVPDEDLQLLETYLDDELSADEEEALRGRLIEEPELAVELSDLRAARSARQAVFVAMEPGELAVADVVARVQSTTRGRSLWQYRLKESFRYVAAAACVIFGVVIGSRGTHNTTAQAPTNDPFAGASQAGMFGQRQVQFTSGALRPIQPAATHVW